MRGRDKKVREVRLELAEAHPSVKMAEQAGRTLNILYRYSRWLEVNCGEFFCNTPEEII